MPRGIIIFLITAVLIFFLLLLTSEGAVALSPRQSRVEREITRIEQVILSLQRTLEWLKDTACGIGLEQYCGDEWGEYVLKVAEPVDDGKEYLGAYDVSRYYTPVKDQERYFYAFKDSSRSCRRVGWVFGDKRARGEYAADLCINAQGDPFKTANGTDLRLQIPLRVVACPPELPMGTKLEVEDVGLVTCLDRGGAIKKKRLDLWLGHGNEAVDLYLETGYLSGLKKVYRIL